MMDHHHHSATGNHAVFALTHDTYYQNKVNWLEMHPLSGDTSDTVARAADMFYTGEKKSLESTNSYMGSRRVSSCTRLYPFYNDEPPYYLEVSQIPNQSPIPFQSNSQTPLERHSLSPGIDPAITELVPSDILGIEQTPLESDFIRKVAASKVQHIPQSPKFLSNSPRRGSILKRGKHGKETKGKKKAKSRTLEQLKDGENRSVDEVPPALKNTCPDEERFIFECQWYHRHKSDEDMWDSIQDDFCKTFNQKHSRDVLRMQFSLAKSKYLQWFSQDEDTLLKAWEQVERDRYKMILETFYELGGSRNMRLNASDIEVKLAGDPAFDQEIYAGRSIKSLLSNVTAKNPPK